MSDYTANIPSADNKRRAIPKKTRFEVFKRDKLRKLMKTFGLDEVLAAIGGDA